VTPMGQSSGAQIHSDDSVTSQSSCPAQGPRLARPENRLLCRASTENRQGVCRSSWMPTDQVRGVKAHGPRPATMIEWWSVRL
jgi:hypothetical protein